MCLLLSETSALVVSLSRSNEAAGSRHTQVEPSALRAPDNKDTQPIMLLSDRTRAAAADTLGAV